MREMMVALACLARACTDCCCFHWAILGVACSTRIFTHGRNKTEMLPATQRKSWKRMESKQQTYAIWQWWHVWHISHEDEIYPTNPKNNAYWLDIYIYIVYLSHMKPHFHLGKSPPSQSTKVAAPNKRQITMIVWYWLLLISSISYPPLEIYNLD
jgi:hypothetical protein